MRQKSAYHAKYLRMSWTYLDQPFHPSTNPEILVEIGPLASEKQVL